MIWENNILHHYRMVINIDYERFFVTLLALSDNLTTQIDNLSSQKGRKFTNYHTSRNLIQGKLCATRSHHLLILIDRFWFQPNPSYTHYALTRTNFWLKLRKFWSENWPKMTFHKSSQLIAQSIQDIKTSWLSTIWHQIDEFSIRKPKKTTRKSYFRTLSLLITKSNTTKP